MRTNPVRRIRYSYTYISDYSIWLGGLGVVVDFFLHCVLIIYIYTYKSSSASWYNIYWTPIPVST